MLISRRSHRDHLGGDPREAIKRSLRKRSELIIAIRETFLSTQFLRCKIGLILRLLHSDKQTLESRKVFQSSLVVFASNNEHSTKMKIPSNGYKVKIEARQYRIERIPRMEDYRLIKYHTSNGIMSRDSSRFRHGKMYKMINFPIFQFSSLISTSPSSYVGGRRQNRVGSVVACNSRVPCVVGM